MTFTNSQLANLKLKQDYHGNLYVLVPDEENPAAYYPVWLTVAEQPEASENCEESAFRNHSNFK